jgi:hypothetical protein
MLRYSKHSGSFFSNLLGFHVIYLAAVGAPSTLIFSEVIPPHVPSQSIETGKE